MIVANTVDRSCVDSLTCRRRVLAAGNSAAFPFPFHNVFEAA